MITLCFVLIFIFLLWTFFLSSVKQSLLRLGETLSHDLFPNTSFFYLPFHHLFFKKRSFELLIFSTALSENLARFLYAALSIYCLLTFPWVIALVGLIILLFLLFLIGDFFPKILAFLTPRATLQFTLSISSFFLFLSLPFTLVFLIGASSILRKKREGYTPLEEMRETLVKILQSANIVEELNSSDKKLIESVVNFKDLIVREVMIPRVDLFSLSATTTIKEAAYLIANEGYSRVPVYRGTIDNTIGVLMYKDILEMYMKCERGEKEWSTLSQTIETIVKTVFYTPETTKVSTLLQEFKSKQTHLALVIDEYGGTAGVVTIEDILEEIVGDIEDEYDEEEEVLYTLQPGGVGWIVDARMGIKDAEEAFGITLPQEGDYDTIGGYLFHKLGTIPEKGLVVSDPEFDLEVLSSTERSVEKVRITPKVKSDDEAP